MADEYDDDPPPPREGRRKNGNPYKPGNTRADGSYEVGGFRPPKHSRFAKGDGRPRGRRPKGTPNSDSTFMKEYNRQITVTEDGTKRRVTKGHAAQLRLFDNAIRKGSNDAIEKIDQRHRRIAEKREEGARLFGANGDAIRVAYFRSQAARLALDPEAFGHLISIEEGPDDAD